MAFTKMTTAPAKNNKYFMRKASGGYNPCIPGNYPFNAKKTVGIAGMDVLPNCVGWSTGRFNMIIGKGNCNYLGNTNAKNFVDLAKRQGLKVGTEPKEGACICWTSGTYGHVAIVEQVISRTEILVSQSGWSYKGGAMWIAKHQKGSDGQWTAGGDKSWMKNDYKFLGFIYQPEPEPAPKKTDDAEIIRKHITRKSMLVDNARMDIPAIYSDGRWYVQLAALDEIMHIAKVGYDAATNTPTITD